MNWDSVAAMAEMLGAIAVVVSLIYLGRQVRQNTTAVRTGNANTVQNNFQKLAKLFYTDPEMTAIVMRAMESDKDLTPVQRLGAYAYFFDFLKTAELAHYHLRKGELDEELWIASMAFYKAYFTTPGFKAYWKERKVSFVPAFQEVVDQWLTEEPPIKRPDEMSKAGINQ